MKQTSNVGRWRLIGVAAMAALALVGTSQANVTFSSATSTVHINPTNSKVRIGKASNVTGWGQRSIIRAFGNNASTAWAEAYTNGSVVGKNGVSGVTKPARINFVDANSNAIASLGSNATLALIPATSNNLVLTARTYSSSILVLRSRADSTTILLRAMSNTVLTLSSLLRTTSNLINVINNNLTVPTSDSIDGTQFMRYHTGHHVFHNGASTVRGWVRFNNGFTVMPGGTALMDTLTTVSGPIDLRDAGTLILNNDLYLAHNVTLTSGGNIKGQASSTGQANTIFMGGDLTLSNTVGTLVLRVAGNLLSGSHPGDLVIDGCGHTLYLGDWAQIFVDPNVTLTLRNMTIQMGVKSYLRPPIQLAALGSKLALDNVIVNLEGDFRFNQGQLFIHDDVAITGTSSFIYTSPRSSYITSGATWSFEQGTTFSLAPATYTDVPYTAGTATTNNFFVFEDASSMLCLNGCTLKTTYTGVRLSKGSVLFDNKVSIDTQAGVSISSPTPVTQVGTPQPLSYYSDGLAWTPDGRFLAVACYNGNLVQIYRINPDASMQLVTTTGTDNAPHVLAWTKDGRYLVIVNYNANNLQVFQFVGSRRLIQIGSSVATGSQPFGVAWSPDGRFLVVGNSNSNNVQVYSFDGVNTPVSLGTGTSGTTRSGQSYVTWSPDGQFFAVSCSFDFYIQVFQLGPTGAPVFLWELNPGTWPRGIVWSPDGRFLAVITGYISGAALVMYRFNGVSAPVSIGSYPLGGNFGPRGLVWSSDGRFLATVHDNDNSIQLFQFNGLSAPTSLGKVSIANNPRGIDWGVGSYIAVAQTNAQNALLFSPNLIATDPLTQGFSNGLVFSDKAQGSAFDANVQILSGAVVKVKGKIKDDSV